MKFVFVFFFSPQDNTDEVKPSPPLQVGIGTADNANAIFLTDDVSDSVSIQCFSFPQVATSEPKPSTDSVSTLTLILTFLV